MMTHLARIKLTVNFFNIIKVQLHILHSAIITPASLSTILISKIFMGGDKAKAKASFILYLGFTVHFFSL